MTHSQNQVFLCVYEACVSNNFIILYYFEHVYAHQNGAPEQPRNNPGTTPERAMTFAMVRVGLCDGCVEFRETVRYWVRSGAMVCLGGRRQDEGREAESLLLCVRMVLVRS